MSDTSAVPALRCTCCGRPRRRRRDGFWSLQNYSGISGMFCHPCYRLVELDAWGRPVHPRARARIKARLQRQTRNTIEV